VPGGGVEPPRGCPRRILSNLRLATEALRFYCLQPLDPFASDGTPWFCIVPSRSFGHTLGIHFVLRISAQRISKNPRIHFITLLTDWDHELFGLPNMVAPVSR
jgi:hypothetical protein